MSTAAPGGTIASWIEHAEELAGLVKDRLVVRWDRHGRYYLKDGQVKPWTANELTEADLLRHFAEPCLENTIGLHSSAVIGDRSVCKWGGIDIDRHGEAGDPEANFRTAVAWESRLVELGFRPLLTDSDGRGGFHLRVLFAELVPSERVHRFLRSFVRGWREFGLDKEPETFPKQESILDTPHQCGNWMRVFGRHHKRDHFTRVHDGLEWLEGHDAVQFILGLTGDPTSLIPADVESQDGRNGVRRRTRPRGERPSASEQDVSYAAAALRVLPQKYRDDYDRWIKVLCCLRELGEAGLRLAREWSMGSTKYSAGDVDAKWGTLSEQGLTLGSLFAVAHHHGWVPPWKLNGEPTAPGSEGAAVGFMGTPGAFPPEFTEPPRPIRTVLRPVPFLPSELLPPPLRPWILDVAERMQCSLEFPAVAAVIVLGTLVGRKFGIRPKRRDDWTVIANLWGLIVGRPGVLKSPALQEVIQALKRLIADAMKRHEEEVERHHREAIISQARREAAKNGLKRAAKRGADEAELAMLAQDAMTAKDAAEPVLHRYMTSDATVEKLGELLNENSNGLLIFRDEIIGLLRTLEKEGHESDRAFLLQGWNGTGGFTWDRIGRGTVHVDAVCLSILGGIQPGPLGIYQRAATRGAGDDGLISRFQLAVWPDQDRDFRIVDRYPDTTAKSRAFEVLRDLDEINPDAIGAQKDEGDEPPYLRFDEEAQEFFYEWLTDLETTKLRAQESPAVESHLAKYRSLMPALALLFHLAELVDPVGEARPGPIALSHARRSAAWCGLMEEHARRIYEFGSEGDRQPAQTLAERLDSLPDSFTARDVTRKGWADLTTHEDVDRALGTLEEHGWVKGVETPSTVKGGRPTIHYYPNPRRPGRGPQ